MTTTAVKLRFLRSLWHRQSLVRGFLATCAVLAVVWFAPSAIVPKGLSGTTKLIIAWDLGLMVYLWSMRGLMKCVTIEQMRDYATRLQASRQIVLLGSSIAAAAALCTVFLEMKLAKGDHGLTQALRICLVIATVALSWFFVQTIFALDYAHEYYADGDAPGRQDREGLKFPGGEPPDFWDFLHFAVTIGVAAQTADITIDAKRMRRLVTIQALIAFSFNAVILALTINLTAGLM
jgi:uncharacterized membrane protein